MALPLAGAGTSETAELDAPGDVVTLLGWLLRRGPERGPDQRAGDGLGRRQPRHQTGGAPPRVSVVSTIRSTRSGGNALVSAPHRHSVQQPAIRRQSFRPVMRYNLIISHDDHLMQVH